MQINFYLRDPSTPTTAGLPIDLVTISTSGMTAFSRRTLTTTRSITITLEVKVIFELLLLLITNSHSDK